MEWLSDPQVWLAFFTLTVLEIVLGIDNVIFISILAGKLPPEQQRKARTTGLALALITRVLLLCTISWLMGLTSALFTIPIAALPHEASEVTGKDLILFIGGLFLIYKSVHEIHAKLEGEEEKTSGRTAASFGNVVTQIILLDIVFSLDSVITAVGMANQLGVMIAAVIVAVIVMMISSGSISDFVNHHPTVKMLALSFLLLIGMVLVADGCGQHISKGYIYFAMAFSVAVEMLNLRMRARQRVVTEPVELHQRYK